MRKIFSVLFLTILLFASDAFAQKDRLISEVQGDKNFSPFVDESVKLTGIVTARLSGGFFLQTPDDKTDGNPATSEGIYVYTKSEPPGEAAVGNLVSVTGTVLEYTPKQEPLSLPITQLSMYKDRDTIRAVSKANALPKPIVLTNAEVSKSVIDALERFEGMRVQTDELTVVAPTGGRVDDKTATSNSNGIFYAVIKGTPRPFREPGIEIYDYQLLKDKDKEKMKQDYPKLPIFDNNPERLRIESAAQLGAQTINVTAFSTVKDLTGVLHYAYRAYAILTDVDSRHTVSGAVKADPLPAPLDRQFSIAGTNLENLFDDEDDPEIKEDLVTKEAFQKRLRKISLAVRVYMAMPDVVGVIEAENLAVLKKLAERINADAVAAGQPNPKYEAYLIDGNDGRGIDCGFLVKSSRVKVIEVKQFGKTETFKTRTGKDEVTITVQTNEGEFSEKFKTGSKKIDDVLNDRPPLMLRASIDDPKTGKPFEFTAIVNHLKSFLGVDDPKDGGARVRLKRRLQAEFLAKIVQERQTANPNERIVLLGDFNAYQFNDGIGDSIGTIKGTPAAKESVMNFSEDLVNPDLTNLVDFKPADQRYSYSFDGNAQVLDHVLINEAMKKHIANFGYARTNADFPQTYRNDETRVERFSDHDAAVVYFMFDERPAAGGGSKANQSPKK